MGRFRSVATDQSSSRTFLSADHHPISGLEPFHRQLEKERIRQEIIANEMAQRRMLEAEVRMELRMEREAGMLTTYPKDPSFMAFAQRSAVPRVTLKKKKNKSLEDMVSKMIDERLAVLLPGLHKHGAGVVAVEEEDEAHLSDLPEESEVDRIVFKAKPNDETESSGSKPDMEELTEELAAVEKKPMIQWSCELCQTMATSEMSLKEHYQGKKHRSKQAALEARGNANHFFIGVSPKLESPGEEVVEEEEEEDANPKKGGKYPFWCEICKVGTHSPKVLEDHKRGKMHLKREAKSS